MHTSATGKERSHAGGTGKVAGERNEIILYLVMVSQRWDCTLYQRLHELRISKCPYTSRTGSL